MLKNFIWFALGVIATTVVFLRWYLPNASEEGPRSSVAATTVSPDREVDASLRQSDLPVSESPGTESGAPDRSVRPASNLPTRATDPSSWELPEEYLQAQEAHFLELAAATGRTAEDVRELTEQSYDFRSEFPDRHETFASEESDASGDLAWLESVVSNQAWAVAGRPYPPTALETECRLSGCRVFLNYSPGDTGAAFRSTVDLRLLADLETYGFEAAEAVIPGPESERTEPGFDIFLWRRPDSP